MFDRDIYKQGNTRTFRRAQTYAGRTSQRITVPIRDIGGTTLRLPTGRNVLSPVGAEIPTSTLATGSVFGGVNGGLGAAATPVGPTMLSGFGSSLSKAGVGIMNTFGSIIPLAIKVIIAVIVIKIVLWLVKRR